MEIKHISFDCNGHRIEVRDNTIRYEGREVAQIKNAWFSPDQGAFTAMEDGKEIPYVLEWNQPLFGSSEYVKLFRDGQIVLELAE